VRIIERAGDASQSAPNAKGVAMKKFLASAVGASLFGAGALGITPFGMSAAPGADLVAALRSGQSVAQTATAHNVDPQKVIDALVAAARSKLDADVAAGMLT
jgi:hypothetical protein